MTEFNVARRTRTIPTLMGGNGRPEVSKAAEVLCALLLPGRLQLERLMTTRPAHTRRMGGRHD